MTGGRYQNGCRYQLRYLISADCKAVRAKGSEVATSDPLFSGVEWRPNFFLLALRPLQARRGGFFAVKPRLVFGLVSHLIWLIANCCSLQSGVYFSTPSSKPT